MLSLKPYSVHRNLSYFDPFRELAELDRAFRPSGLMFTTDIRETENAYELESDLPGFRKEDISIDIEEDRLTVSAERKQEERAEEKNGYVHVERSFGSYSRSFDLSGIDTEGITASYTDGVLKITLPKKPEEKPEKRRLEIA